MAEWSQSQFLQSLGWATLNSFWQMALLWCLYSGAAALFRLSAAQKYRLSVASVFTGFAWFLASFIYYYQSGTASSFSLLSQPVGASASLFQVVLTAASLAYLGLLLVPAYKLFRNWQFVRRIKRQGLQKADLHYRLFVQKIAARIGIRKKVWLYVSELVTSPVTFGYLKPVILLPVAALNNLSVSQVEAVLLHELSHIKRYDYLVNLVISCIQTLLYFNPFVKLFVRNIEAERENCCDELVLQFGYDKVGYATALLTLEKVSAQKQVLAIAATGKNYLLNRIEKIVGMEKKNKGMKFNHLAGLLAALFCILVFNSVLIIREEKQQSTYLAYDNISNPFGILHPGTDRMAEHSVTPTPRMGGNEALASTNGVAVAHVFTFDHAEPATEPPATYQPAPEFGSGHFLQVSRDEVDASLSKEEKQQVKTTVDATKQLLKSQWPVVEETIGDAMDSREKELARQQYLKEIEKINWDQIEKNFKSAYNNVNWEVVNATVQNALVSAQLDSVQKSYDNIVNQLAKTNAEIKALAAAKVSCTPLPDCSVEELKKAQVEMRKQADSLRANKNRKIISL